MNIEFSKISFDKVGREKAEGHVLPLIPVGVTRCPVSMSRSHGTSHLTDVTADIFNERAGFLLFVWRSIHFLIATGKRQEIGQRKIQAKKKKAFLMVRKEKLQSWLSREAEAASLEVD